MPAISNIIIQIFIFVYHFIQKENIDKIQKYLNLIDIKFLPIIDYDLDRKHLFI